MTDFVSTWNNDLLTVPFAPLGLIAMPGCPLTKEEMVNVQKRIAEKKAAAQSEFYKEQLQ